MGSRIRENPDKVFELFTEIAKPSDPSQGPFVLQQYPPDYSDEEVVKSIPKFAFPCDADSNAVDHFTFVLTDIDSKFKFGFCRHGTTGAQTCLLIISHFPWFEVFYKLLNHIAEVLNRSEDNNVDLLLDRLYNLDTPLLVPLSEVEVVTPDLKDSFSFYPPEPNQLSSIPESRNLTEYYNAVDTNNMMIIFASMMFERRILITSRKLSRLTACLHSSASLLYPMHWQHLYIPILPIHLLDYVSAPMPYIIGIHSSLMEDARKKQELGDAVILDCDNNTVVSEYDDLANLPPEIVTSLKKRLKTLQTQSEKMKLMGDGLSRAFLKALVSLIGGYRDALKFRTGEQITFDPEAFIHSRPTTMQPFLEQMLQLQIFEQFINDRLELLNSGQGFSDEFEIEANMWADKTGTQSKYKEWLTQAKKQGKKLRREGKDRWAEFTSKVKDKGKKAYKDLRSRLDEVKKEEGGSPVSRGRPATIPTSDLRRHRQSGPDDLRIPDMPPRPPPPSSEIGRNSTLNSINNQLRRTSYENRPFSSRQYKILNVEDMNAEDAMAARVTRRISSDDADAEIVYDRVSVGLMDDPDIQQVFKRSFSMEDVTRLAEEEEEELAQDALRVYGYDSSTPSDRSKSSTPAPSPTPISRPRPSTPAGSSIHSTDSDVVLPRPVPPPRIKKREEPVPAHKPLISLDSLESEKQKDKSENTIDRETEYKHFSSEFDPLENVTKNSSQSDVSISSSEFTQGDDVHGQDNLNNNESSESKLKHRTSITRHNAFYKIQKPPSVKRRSPQPLATDAQTIKEARTAFIQSEVTKPSMSNELDIFDPLQTGQLAVDSTAVPPGVNNNRARPASVANDIQQQAKSSEDNLLKEWNLDFGKMNLSAGKQNQKPPVPPKPSLSPGVRPPVSKTTLMSPPLGMQQPGMVLSGQPYVSQRHSMSHAFIPQGAQFYNPAMISGQPSVYGAMPYSHRQQTGFAAVRTTLPVSKPALAKKPSLSPSKSPLSSDDKDPFGDLVTLPVSPSRSPSHSAQLPVSPMHLIQQKPSKWETFE